VNADKTGKEKREKERVGWVGRAVLLPRAVPAEGGCAATKGRRSRLPRGEPPAPPGWPLADGRLGRDKTGMRRGRKERRRGKAGRGGWERRRKRVGAWNDAPGLLATKLEGKRLD